MKLVSVKGNGAVRLGIDIDGKYADAAASYERLLNEKPPRYLRRMEHFFEAWRTRHGRRPAHRRSGAETSRRRRLVGRSADRRLCRTRPNCFVWRATTPSISKKAAAKRLKKNGRPPASS